ncbi:MAG TPA: thioredoxin family protein [Phnomibacter sp.]|nr:thioredoxin family protein [Phnomibacter sp.]
MKRTLVFFAVVLLAMQATHTHAQQKLFEVLPDSAEKKLLMGIVALQDIKGDTCFAWYPAALKYYKPNAALVKAFKEKAGQFSLLIFTGTWCHDSQQITPKYFACLEAAGIPETAYTIVATDRHKTTIAHLHSVFQVVNVPTIIVLKNGKEVGRIEEYGKTGLPDQELAGLMQSL